MISKNQLKHIRALGQKKQRKALGEFLVQGEKNVLELLKSNLIVKQLFATPEFINIHKGVLSGIYVIEADIDSLTKVSTLVSNNSVIAVVQIPTVNTPPNTGITLALDGVSDPGNLGTIIRVADWYGINHIVCSHDCSDPFNPKTISATMGSFARVNVFLTDLPEYLHQDSRAVYGAYLGGENVHKVTFDKDAILMMGSESHGIREAAGQFVTSPITIPNFGEAESLNVAMATGIILDNMKRG
ncbi:RNA methyltransferase [uncultured Psychrosphaera sp.]|uniref:TrmH family RNA methyltransferase n=1 Tax=uncultured Psychrosphaera sp. TaxID=1403522 RepID=UPI002630A4D4|nr:RNA methyltransferase [uncultured Psychrosphaera sp.]